MSSQQIDRTLIDIGRREPNIREYVVEDALSQHIVESYPKFVSFLQEYFKFEETVESPSHLIQELFYTRDVTQTDLELLSYIEDELLLGQAYFEGFTDKRAAAKYSSTLYKSKGTKYSIQQFFRTFFNVDPDVVYTKRQIFNVGESIIGAESQRYLTDDKLYQQYALLIKTELSVSQWRKPYKLFVHPAGMYLGAEVQLVGQFDLNIEEQPFPGLKDIPEFEVEGIATMGRDAISSMTGLFNFNAPDGTTQLFRTTLGSESTYPNPGGNDINDLKNITIEEVANLYSTMGEYLEADAPTFDEDTDTEGSGMGLSSIETIDQDKFDWVDSDGITNLDELFDSAYNPNL
tara:strand:- start:1042 stop:2082 length:1041 start_codon:yes stop_codon:yes gene_type:complete